MSLRAEITTTICAVGCALGIGYVMQQGDVAELRYGGSGHGLLATGYFVGELADTDPDAPVPLDLDENALASVELELTSGEISKAALIGSITQRREEVDPLVTSCDSVELPCAQTDSDAHIDPKAGRIIDE